LFQKKQLWNIPEHRESSTLPKLFSVVKVAGSQ